jgi:predicted nucleotide-binding protein
MRFARPEDLNGILDAVRTEITKWCTKLIVDETPRDGAAAPTDEQQSGGDREIDERQRERGEGRIVRDSRKVWVVHGRNLKARDAMFTFLRAIGLEPMEWGEALALTGKGTPYTGEVLDLAFAEAQAVVVLITGDDMARLGTRFADAHDPPEETNPTPQARPNVLFEAGMAFGKCPERTVLVQLGKTRAFSDVAGRNLLYISNDVKRRQGLVDRLRIAGAAVRIENRTDWHTAGNFDDADEPPDCTEQVSEADADLKAFTEVIRDKFRHANHYTPEIGTEEDQQAQRLVKRGLLKPGPLGGYMLARYF